MTAYARSTDPETSHESAMAIRRALPMIEKRILFALEGTYGTGLTTFEITEITGIPRVTVSPRLRPMSRKGVVYETTERREHNGRMSIVWRAK